jgi:hypothetical protein
MQNTRNYFTGVNIINDVNPAIRKAFTMLFMVKRLFLNRAIVLYG